MLKKFQSNNIKVLKKKFNIFFNFSLKILNLKNGEILILIKKYINRWSYQKVK